MKLKLLLISLISFSLLAQVEYKFIHLKHGIIVKNYTNRVLHCWIGDIGFFVQPYKQSRKYPFHKYQVCK